MKPARNVSPADVVKREIKARGGLRRIKQVLTSDQSLTLKCVAHRNHKIGVMEAWHLSQIFGNSQEFWLNIQAAYDSRNTTEQHVTGSIGAIPQGIAASDSIEWDSGRVVVKRKGAK